MKKVATVITCINEVEYIERAISSALDQETDFEHQVIVVQAGKNEELAQKIPDEVRHARVPRQSTVSESRNEGRRAAEADFLLYLDADDYSMPGRVQRSVELLEKGYDIIGQVNSSLRLVNEEGRVVRSHRNKEELMDNRTENYNPCDPHRIEDYELMPPSTLGVRADQAVFDPEEEVTEGYEFLLRSLLENKRILPVCEDLTTRLKGKHKDSIRKQSEALNRIKRSYGVK